MSQENVEIARRAVEAWQRDGPDGLLQFFDPEIKFTPVEEGRPLYGHQGVRTNLESWLEEWDDFRVEIREILDSGARVLVALQISARGKGSGLEVAMPIYEVFELRNGLAVTWEEYADREEALEAAGLRE
jgi:ketosteroid isomerase-like protein